jgi:hypothetical protein
MHAAMSCILHESRKSSPSASLKYCRGINRKRGPQTYVLVYIYSEKCHVSINRVKADMPLRNSKVISASAIYSTLFINRETIRKLERCQAVLEVVYDALDIACKVDPRTLGDSRHGVRRLA